MGTVGTQADLHGPFGQRKPHDLRGEAFPGEIDVDRPAIDVRPFGGCRLQHSSPGATGRIDVLGRWGVEGEPATESCDAAQEGTTLKRCPPKSGPHRPHTSETGEDVLVCDLRGHDHDESGQLVRRVMPIFTQLDFFGCEPLGAQLLHDLPR